MSTAREYFESELVITVTQIQGACTEMDDGDRMYLLRVRGPDYDKENDVTVTLAFLPEELAEIAVRTVALLGDNGDAGLVRRRIMRRLSEKRSN